MDVLGMKIVVKVHQSTPENGCHWNENIWFESNLLEDSVENKLDGVGKCEYMKEMKISDEDEKNMSKMW